MLIAHSMISNRRAFVSSCTRVVFKEMCLFVISVRGF